jgi:hypothetical protein
MPIMFILAAAAMGLVLLVLALVVIGIRQEPTSHELTGQAPRLMARMTRRLVGVHVRRPDLPVIPTSSAGETEPCNTTPLAEWAKTPRHERS